MQMILPSILLASSSTMTLLVSGHSWLHCTDYRGDLNYFNSTECHGYPREWHERASWHNVADRQDRAFAGDVCDRPMREAWRDAYNVQYPAAVYEAGSIACLAWTLQNHASWDCPGNNHAKRDPAQRESLSLYISDPDPSKDPDQASFFLRNVNEVAGLASACNPTVGTGHMPTCQLGLQKHEQEGDCRGFQRAPAFCENTGSAQGTGCFYIPETLQPGHYVGQWVWDTLFVRDVPQAIVYKTCFDFEVVPQGTGLKDPTPGTKGVPAANKGKCENNAQYLRQVLAKYCLTSHRTLPYQRSTDFSSLTR